MSKESDVKEFIKAIGKLINKKDIYGSKRFQLETIDDKGRKFFGRIGFRVARITFNAGLDNARLVKALTPEKLIHAVPWDPPLPPCAYVDGRFGVIEAAWESGDQDDRNIVHMN